MSPPTPISKTSSLKKLEVYGLEKWARDLDEGSIEHHKTSIPSDKILRAIGYIAARMFKPAARELNSITPDKNHTLLSLYLNKKLGTPDKDIISWILNFWRYEKNFPLIALKALSAIGEEKKVRLLLKKGINDLNPRISSIQTPANCEHTPYAFKKSSLEYALKYERKETFCTLLEKLTPTEDQLDLILKKALEDEQDSYATYIIRKIKEPIRLYRHYNIIVRKRYGLEDNPKICQELERRMQKDHIKHLIQVIDTTPKKERTLCLERIHKSLSKELSRRLAIQTIKQQEEEFSEI